jgi:hypothetical protein
MNRIFNLKSLALSGLFVSVWLSAHLITAQAFAVENQLPKNLAREGNLAFAMEHGQVLLTALEAANWDFHQVNPELFLLPEQVHHEDAVMREAWQWAYQPGMHEAQAELAFTCSLYTRLNVRVQPGVEASTEPEGHFVVGWKDGRVTLVPVSEARLFPVGDNEKVLVFPGMANYSSDLQLYGRRQS